MSLEWCPVKNNLLITILHDDDDDDYLNLLKAEENLKCEESDLTLNTEMAVERNLVNGNTHTTVEDNYANRWLWCELCDGITYYPVMIDMMQRPRKDFVTLFMIPRVKESKRVRSENL